MANRKKYKKFSKKHKNRMPNKLRNPLAELAHMRQRSGGGKHKDKRMKRVTRKSWKKDWNL